jgi:hypothetical protein
MAANGVQRLKDQLQKLQPRWKQAFDGWVAANDTLRDVLGNLERLLSSASGTPASLPP